MRLDKNSITTLLNRAFHSIVFTKDLVSYIIATPFVRREIPKELKVFLKENSFNRFRIYNKVRKIDRKVSFSVFWGQSGAVIALIVSLLAIVVQRSNIMNVWIEKLTQNNVVVPKEYSFSLKLSAYVLVYFIIYRVLLLVITKIIRHMPPDVYAKTSIASLNESEILVHTCRESMDLCVSLNKALDLDKEILKILEIRKISESQNEDISPNDLFNRWKSAEDVVRFALTLNSKYRYFRKKSFNKVSRTQSLINESARVLKVQKREFTHHLLKFSASIFLRKLSDINYEISRLNNLYQLKQGVDSGNAASTFDEILIVHMDIKKRSEYLAQLICFDDLHKVLIGMAEARSTSKSLKLFVHGLAQIAKPVHFDEGKPDKNRSRINSKLKTLLHRSKAHYGMDLLISLENYVIKCNFDQKIKEQTNYSEDIQEANNSKSIFMSRIHDFMNSNGNKPFLADQYIKLLWQLKIELMKDYKSAIAQIVSNVHTEISEECKILDGSLYLVSFGSSAIVQDTLDFIRGTIKTNKVEIFVMQDDTGDMLDTKSFRLNLTSRRHSKFFKSEGIRRTFTAKDNFFLNLVNQQDKVIFITGAEAYDLELNRLFHTNKYQQRVEKLMGTLNALESKPSCQLWILAGEYKLYTEFPPKNTVFSAEFYSDHYDHVDLYCLNDKIKDIPVKIFREEDSVYVPTRKLCLEQKKE